MTHAEQPEDEDGPAFTVELDWSSGENVPVVPVNMFLAQVGASAKSGRPDGVYLAFGHAAPPLMLGTPEQVKAMIVDQLGCRLPVTVHGKVFMTRDRLDELIELLQDTAAKMDAHGGTPR